MVQVKIKNSVTFRANAVCPSHSVNNISVRDVTFTIDEPIERGGTNTGPSPTETALGALIACTNVIGHKCAKSLGIDIGHLKIDASCELDRRGVLLMEEIDVPFVAAKLVVKADGPADQGELDRVAAETAKYCALAKLFQAAGTKLEVTWEKA